jgi:hypothetical protein
LVYDPGSSRPSEARRVSIRLAVALATLLGPLLAGCNLIAPGPPYTSATAGPIAPEQARLVVYRPNASHLLGAVGDRTVAINGGPACSLSNDYFFVHDAAPGVMTVTDGASSLDVTTEPGQQYFVRVAFNPRRASLAGWVPPLLGIDNDTTAPHAEAGQFAIELVDPRTAGHDLVGVALDPACH